ncbi:thymus-specific serine protease [Electrophorus electricus]|uniref:thymus-specific serine protease n=1 Tax=Electrophorus electricus TaxID=8005 RepID=UPI0015CFC637|nr:thymus-specific serine protease [Electrophorus electricus]
MTPSVIRWVVMILLMDLVSSGRVLWKTKERVRDVRQQKAKQHLMMRAGKGPRAAAALHKEGHVHQPLDHFSAQNTETFPQRFFLNEQFWEPARGPVFLYIEGEGPLSELSVLAGHHVAMAEEHGALLVALEHRFYGTSIHSGALETRNLQHLSSQQALSDLAAFQRYIKQKYNLSRRNTWISFGGSYAGALSAWLRGKFPHLIYGAVASSAPVRAELDFSAYNKVVGRSLMDERVGGSEKCLNNIWEGFRAVEAVLQGGNVAKVGTDFACCEPPTSPEDQAELMQSLADIFMGSVQYNEEGVSLTIARLCDLMTNQDEAGVQDEEAYSRLVKLVEVYRTLEKEPCLDVSHRQTVLTLNKTTDSRSGYRQWFYQTCTEFGFYQTCEDTSCPFSRMLTLQTQTQLCRLLFGLPQHTLSMNIAFTNQYYGGDEPHSQRVLYVNGDIDPWMELSVVRNDGSVDRDRAVVINGTAHCADMNPTRPGDRLSLHQARKEIERHVATWLKYAAWENMDWPTGILGG